MCDYRMLREPKRLKHRLRGEQHKRTFPGQARRLLSDGSALLQGLFEAGHMQPWSKIVKRSLWGTDLRFPVDRYYEDIATTPLLALRAATYWYEPAVWVVYRLRAGSILRTPSLDKAEHKVLALTGLHEATRERALGARARFAWAHFAAQSFIGAARLAARSDSPDRMARLQHYRQALLRVAPLSPAELWRAYLRCGWYWRALRLRYWLQRAQAAQGPHGGGDKFG